jgi:signal transduction histidine kinase
MMLSLRNRLLFGMVAGLTLLLVCSGMLVYMAAKKGLYSQCDASLAATAQMLSASVEDEDGRLKFELDVAMTPRFQKASHPDYYIIELQNGSEAILSPSLDDKTAAFLRDKLRRFGIRSATMPNGQPIRMLKLFIIPKFDSEDNEKPQAAAMQPFVLIAVRDTTELKSHLDSLQWLLFISGIITVALSVAVAVNVVDRGLRPLTTLAANIDNISDQSLQRRLVREGVPPELLPVVDQLNSMLARLEESFYRQRRFNADVAHELRTPLSGLSTSLEVALLRVRNAEEYRDTISTCLPIVRSMQMMVSNLLELTRPDSGQRVPVDTVRLWEVVDSCWRMVAERASSHVLAFENSIPQDLEMQMDRARLAMIISNVLDNAVEYTNPGGRIWAEALQSSGQVAFSVRNTGCTLPPGIASQVFDCFWRGDEARTNTGLHCGLGLTIVKKLTESLGGSVHVESRVQGIFEISFSFPTRNTI